MTTNQSSIGVFGFCWVVSLALGFLYAVTGDDAALASFLGCFTFPFGFALVNVLETEP